MRQLVYTTSLHLWRKEKSAEHQKVTKYYVNNCRITNKRNHETIWCHKKISLEMTEVVLVQCNLLDNQYNQKSGVLYTLRPLNLKLIC